MILRSSARRGDLPERQDNSGKESVMQSITYEIPIRTISEANRRGHWAIFKKLHDAQKLLASQFTKNVLGLLPKGDRRRSLNAVINIHLVRASPRKLDSDNLQSSMKYIRDSVADVLNPGHRPGMADGTDRLKWTYSQRPSGKDEPCVEVTLSWPKESRHE